jgi:hypothetical protein
VTKPETEKLDSHGIKALERCERELQKFIELAGDYDLDEMSVQALQTAIESMQMRREGSLRAQVGGEAQTMPKPTRVHVVGETAFVVGTPQRNWDEESEDAHNCDYMGCGSFGPHVLFRVPVTIEPMPAPAPDAVESIINDMECDASDIRLGRQWMAACEHYAKKLRAHARSAGGE